MARKKIGEILLENKCINQDQLNKALLHQQGSNKPLGRILEEMDLVLEEDIARALASQFGFPLALHMARHQFPANTLELIDADTAIAHLVFPLKLENKTLYLAMANPLNMSLQSDLAFKLGVRISPCVSTASDIKNAIVNHYKREISTPIKNRIWEILLVDSHELSLNTAEAVLKKEGYVVHKALDGAEGLKLAAQLRPDLIVTEIVLPRMDGIALFKALKENSDLEEIPVLALTGKSTAEDECKLLDIGFYDVIPKPLNPMRLQARVKRARRWYKK